MKISVHPNPTAGVFNVELVGLNGIDAELRITDIGGKLILSKTLHGIGGHYIEEIDISRHETGMYIVELIGENGVKLSRRIIKE